MDQRNRKELMAHIEQQEAKIKKYESKIRDVVAAYKGLLNEKSALEATIRSLSNSSNHHGSGEDNASPSGSTDKATDKAKDFIDPLNVKGAPVSESGASKVATSEQISTLTKAMTTLTEEKSRMEASFQADKKRLRQEKEELEHKLKEEQMKRKTSDKLLQNQIQELKDKLRSQQYNHEREQNNQQIMLRELQKRINSERMAREKLENDLEEAQILIALKESQPNRTVEYEQEIQTLERELQESSEKLKIAEEKLSHTEPLLVEFRREISAIKMKQHANLQEEEQQVKETAQSLEQMAIISENRAAELETRVAELSETIGTYERQRQQDLNSIQRLKERISYLDMENGALACATKCLTYNSSWEKESDELSLDVDGLIEKITKLKELLKKAKEKSRSSFSELINNDTDLQLNQLLTENIHEKCQNELQQLREEFDQYKVYCQSLFKSNKKDNDSNKEAEIFRNQISDLKQKISKMKVDMVESEQNHATTVTVLHTTLSELKANHKQQLLITEAEWKAKLIDIEDQLQKQRERSLSLLEEKDRDILFLRSQTNPKYHRIKKKGQTSLKDSELTSQHENNHHTTTEEILSELSGSIVTDKKEAQFLHYIQEMARKEVEISNLRRSKHQLETNQREMQLQSSSKEESYNQQIEDLSNKLSRLEANCSREGANLEYLKNVVLSYMLSSSATSRQHMLNAIGAVLKLTQKELECVKDYNSRWW